MADLRVGSTNDDKGNIWYDKTQLYALSGNDTIISDNKQDILLVGGSGDDSLVMMGGNGTLSGGKGSDTFELTYSVTKPLSAVIEDLDPSSDKIVINHVGDTAPQLSSITSSNGDVIWKDSQGNLNLTLKSVRDNDYFDGAASEEIWGVLYATNEYRDFEDLPLLTLSDGLMTGASIRAQEITGLAQTGALSNHTRPDGTNFFTVLNGKYLICGENLDAGAESLQKVMDDWIGSASHYANIKDARFTKLGVGYNYYDEGGNSAFRYYWAQLFADGLNNPETVSTAEILTADIEVNTVSKFITLTDNTYSNTAYGATISGTSSADSITNEKEIVSISSGAGADTITNSGAYDTINAGVGDDLISLSSNAWNNLIEYRAGDGFDTIYGFSDDSTLNISGDEFTPMYVGDDLIITVGANTITLLDVANNYNVNIYGIQSKLRFFTDDANHINNEIDGATINALGGDDSIKNYGSFVSIDAGNGDDTVHNFGASVSIAGGSGKDIVYNEGTNVIILGEEDNDVIANYDSANVTMDGGAGNDTLLNNSSENVSINGGDDNDFIGNDSANVTIDGGAGNDRIINQSSNVTIEGGAGNDNIANLGNSVMIYCGNGNDAITNIGSDVAILSNDGDNDIYNLGSNVTITNGAGKDSVKSRGSNILIDGGAGKDYISLLGGSSMTINGGDDDDWIVNVGASNSSINASDGNDNILSFIENASINGGAGNDQISLYDGAKENVIEYTLGDGNDTIEGFDVNDTLRISGSSYTSATIGKDIFLATGTGYIKLSNATSLSAVNIVGEENDELKLFLLTEDDDTYQNTDFFATIEALGGNDTITNSGALAVINGDIGDDFIFNDGENVTINGGAGNDQISLSGNAKSNLIEYASGDGSDSIVGFNTSSTLQIGGTSNYATAVSGEDIIVTVDEETIALLGAAGLSSVHIVNKEETGGGSKLIVLTESDKKYTNTVVGVTIQALGGKHGIINHGSEVSINSSDSEDNCVIFNDGDLVTLDCGAGNDLIYSSGSNVTISSEDGNDSIDNRGDSVLIDAGAGNDTIRNNDNYVTIDAGDGDDQIDNVNSYAVSIVSGTGNDSIYNSGSNVTIDGGAGNDEIWNKSDNISIDGGAGEDDIGNGGKNVTLNGGANNDNIDNDGDSVTIDAGDGDDSIKNDGDNISILGGAGNDTLRDRGNFVTMNGGEGNDEFVVESNGSNIEIYGGSGNDTFVNANGTDISMDGGDGDDVIVIVAGNISIDGGAGNDEIIFGENATNNLIVYKAGDGNDLIEGFDKNDTLNIWAENYSSVTSVDDIIITVGEGTIILKDARDKPTHIILGESGSSGGVSGGGDNGGNSSGGNGGNSSSGNGGNSSDNTNNQSNTVGNISSGGKVSNGGNVSGNISSGNIGGVNTRGNINSSGNINTGGSINTGDNSNRDGYSGGNGNVSATPFSSPFDTLKTTTPIVNRHIYAGGNQVIDNYTSGQKIMLGTLPTGYVFGGDNFALTSDSGTLIIQGVKDKVIDFVDGAGNDFLKAYSATNAGLIDGRGLAGFEVIAGSDIGSDLIFAGDNGSSLWGGNGVHSDTLVGGNGMDIFVSGKNQGADTFVNASANDIVFLSDSMLSDIVATAGTDNAVAVAFNTGNVLMVGSSEPLSAAFMLADGSAYRYNHVTKAWQTA